MPLSWFGAGGGAVGGGGKGGGPAAASASAGAGVCRSWPRGKAFKAFIGSGAGAATFESGEL